MFKKTKTFADYVIEKVSNNEIVEMRENAKDIAMEDAINAIETTAKYCLNYNLAYGTHLHYLGFNFGNEKHSKIIHSISFMPTPHYIENLFVKEMKTVENMLGFFCELNEDIVPDFFQTFGRNISVDFAKSIDMENMSEANEEVVKLVSEHLFKRMIEWESGYYEDVSFGVGETFYIFFCNKEIVKKNIVTICSFVQTYLKKLISEKQNYKFLYNTDCEYLFKICPQILTNEELSAEFIANAEYRILSYILETVPLNKNMVLSALKLNPKCYCYLPDEYLKDKEICIELLNLDLEMIRFIIEYGPIDVEEWKKHCISILKGESYE